MVEVIICTVNTGRVHRKQFTTWDKADEYVDRFFSPDLKRPRSRRDFRVEINRGTPPAESVLQQPAHQTPAMAPAA